MSQSEEHEKNSVSQFNQMRSHYHSTQQFSFHSSPLHEQYFGHPFQIPYHQILCSHPFLVPYYKNMTTSFRIVAHLSATCPCTVFPMSWVIKKLSIFHVTLRHQSQSQCIFHHSLHLFSASLPFLL